MDIALETAAWKIPENAAEVLNQELLMTRYLFFGGVRGR